MGIRHPVDDAVEESRRDVLEPSAVGTVLPHHSDHVVAFGIEAHYLRQHCRRVLQVGIHAHNPISIRMVDACYHGGLVAEVAREVDGFRIRIVGHQPVEQQSAAVGAAVVDIDYFDIIIQLPNRLFQLIVEMLQDSFLIVYRHDDRKVYSFHGSVSYIVFVTEKVFRCFVFHAVC